MAFQSVTQMTHLSVFTCCSVTQYMSNMKCISILVISQFFLNRMLYFLAQQPETCSNDHVKLKARFSAVLILNGLHITMYCIQLKPYKHISHVCTVSFSVNVAHIVS